MLGLELDDWTRLGLVAVSLVVACLPRLRPHACMLGTVFHETGHAVVALATRGLVERIDLAADGSGACAYRCRGRFSRILVSAAGYPSAVICGLAMLWALLEGHAGLVLVVLLGLVVALLVLWVRNGHGVAWLLGLACVLVALEWFGRPSLTFAALFVLAVASLVDAARAARIVLLRSIRDPAQAGDAAALARDAWLPAPAWAALFALVTACALLAAGALLLEGHDT